MTILYIIIVLLITIIVLLAGSLFFLIKKNIYLSDNEKDFITFVIDIFIEYGDDLGIQSKDQHKKLIKELEKIKTKHLK